MIMLYCLYMYNTTLGGLICIIIILFPISVTSWTWRSSSMKVTPQTTKQTESLIWWASRLSNTTSTTPAASSPIQTSPMWSSYEDALCSTYSILFFLACSSMELVRFIVITSCCLRLGFSLIPWEQWILSG